MNTFGPGRPQDDQLPPGGMPVGNGVMYPDLQGNLHPTPGEAINANQRVESDYSRGGSGGCGQDAGRVPPPDFGNRGGGW